MQLFCRSLPLQPFQNHFIIFRPVREHAVRTVLDAAAVLSFMPARIARTAGKMVQRAIAEKAVEGFVLSAGMTRVIFTVCIFKIFFRIFHLFFIEFPLRRKFYFMFGLRPMEKRSVPVSCMQACFVRYVRFSASCFLSRQ